MGTGNRGASVTRSRAPMILIEIVSLYLWAQMFQFVESQSVRPFPMLMPKVQPNKKDSYLCTAFKMPRYETEYVIEFTPNATMETAHHILIYGCKIPGYYERDTPRAVWECGEMANSVDAESPYLRAPICNGPQSIIYAWAMDAPSLVLPEKVGFKVGKGTDLSFLILQVHYAHVDRFINGDLDQSGVVLSMVPASENRVTKRAGVLLLGTAGSLRPNSVERMETSCKITQSIKLHPFAFRTHTHKLGKVVSGWLIENGKWRLIGKRDPQQPQMFYPITDESIVIKQGDIVAARCTMKNYLPHRVDVGSTGDDEMCNFYIMFWVDGDQDLEHKYCFSDGPPTYHWENNLGAISREINREASSLF